MHNFQVTRIIDGDTFEVNPNWQWNGQSGDRVRPTGYDAAEIGSRGAAAATSWLSNLILGRTVGLGSAYKIDRGRLVCDVYFNGRSLADYYRSRSPA